jgi:hypothetical protein
MLPGDAPAGRGAPGRGAPGRGACGRRAGRSTGCAEENGLLPTRGVRGPGRGAPPGVGPGRVGLGAGAATAGADAAGAAGRAGPGAGAAGAAGGGVGAGADGFWAVSVGAGAVATALPSDPPAATRAGAPFEAACPLPAGFWAAGLPPPNASRKRRATGASTVDDADFTNSPCSLSRASTSLLVTPSSLANSCTRALPATTSPV